MIACLDVDYRDAGASAASITFRDWIDERPIEEAVVAITGVQHYEPGQFYRRELPCLQEVLRALEKPPTTVIIDGYVWLGEESDWGLGAHLYQALRKQVGIIGVAKTRFRGTRVVQEVLRGGSQRPLYVTAVGVELAEAARRIREMEGPFRVPTLLRRVDQLCRGRVEPQ